MAEQVFPSFASAFSMTCSEKGNLTEEDFFFYRKKAGSFSHQKRDRTTWEGIYQKKPI